MLGSCGNPGPGLAHCTYLPGHHYSHYDATRGVSWSPAESRDRWQAEHDRSACSEPQCVARRSDQG